MPTVTVTRDVLYHRLNRTYTDEQFEDLCFDFGVELDDIVEEEGITKFKIDIPANRYDLLCVEGLSQGLNVFLGKTTLPRYTVLRARERLHVDGSVEGVRPYVVAAVLRDITLTEDSYNSFILLQDKLHQNIGRERSLVSIGTHDLDTIQGPFKYHALPPPEIKFQPLNQDTVMTAPQMFDIFRKNYLKPYLQIIESSPVYPLITDVNGTVLSLPPVINGNHSKISLSTRNIFIEVTAKDRKKAGIVLDTICGAFSEYCTTPHTIEAVEIVQSDGSTFSSPKMGSRIEEYDSAELCLKSGIKTATPEQLADLLTKMCLRASVAGEKLKVEIGPTRHDILHQCDVEEDIAIAYGYNNIPQVLPDLYTIAVEQDVNKLSDSVREELARCGFTEVLTFSLCSRDDVSVNLRIPEAVGGAVQISNPKTFEFQVVRTTLLPGMLKTASCNRNMPLPLKLFEVSDIVVKDTLTETGTKNYRYVCALFAGKTSGFEVVHGLLDRVMLMLDVKDYHIQQTSDPMFFPGRGADIILGTKKIGHLGILHPEVLEKFDVTLPCSVLEFNLDPFV